MRRSVGDQHSAGDETAEQSSEETNKEGEGEWEWLWVVDSAYDKNDCM